MGFTHLHLHTEFSALDGLGTVQHYVDRAVELGMSALAITDHGVMCGHPQFYKACRKAEIEPLLGEEFYYVDDVAWRPARGEGQPERAHFGVIAKGEKGYHVLAELSTEAHRHYYYKPVIGRSQLEQLGDDAKHLVVNSGCAASVISRAILAGNWDEAEERVMWWRETFPNFYIELMHHYTDFDLILNAGLIKLAKKYGIPWVITNDPHYVVPEDYCHHDTLLAIQTAADIDDPSRFSFDGKGYHLKSQQEMRRMFIKNYGREIWVPGMNETSRVARMCKTRIPAWESRTWMLPSFEDAEGDSNGMLKRLAWEGLRTKKLRGGDKQIYKERMRFELDTFKETGVADFLLITWWCIQQAKLGGTNPHLGPIPVGPGRGSVCGSLVGYLIGLHKIDPVLYDLRFDRFLNPARPKMPDIDTDFGQTRRGEMFDVVQNKFGRENVVHVCQYSNMKTKAAFQSLARAHGISFPDRIRLSKEINEDDEGAATLPAEVTENFPDLADQLKRLSGVKKGISTHPAGVIIASPETRIRELVPEMWIANTKRWVGQYDLYAVEAMGLMKQDFLGLRTLDTITEAVRLIKETTGEELDQDSWWPDHEEGDDKVYAMLAEGRTAGVFQMEGPTNQRGIKAIGPTCFEDIVSCTSLYRTGAISAGFPAIFLENRQHAVKDIPYVHIKLKPILEHTWGVVLYQEQVMDMAEQLAGFTGAQIADIVEAIKHKSGPLMQSMKEVFIEGCYTHSRIKRSIGTKIWKMIEGYSGYGYNRSHAVAYTFTTYQTARLKALWPWQYMCALLRTVDTSTKEGKEKRDVYLREAVEMGVKILPPDINLSDISATTERTGPEGRKRAIRLGLTDFAGIGVSAAQKAVQGRPGGGYREVSEVAAAVRNVGTLKVLSEGGALACLTDEEPNIKRVEELVNWRFTDSIAKYRRQYSDQVFLPRDATDEDNEVVILGEIYSIDKSRRTKNDKPYATWKVRYSITDSFDIRLWSTTERHWNLKEGSIVMVQGKWESRWQNISVGDPRQIKVIKRVTSAAH